MQNFRLRHILPTLAFVGLYSLSSAGAAPTKAPVEPNSTDIYKTISQGSEAGIYQAFPDAYRLQNGDIVAVFYAGYQHVSYPNADYPKGGRICMVRSKDEGRTWTAPKVIFDDESDNRDAHVSQLSDGTILVSLFSLYRDETAKTRMGTGVQLIRSEDGGETWSEKAMPVTDNTWYSSAPVRELADGSCILPIYHQTRGKKGNAGGGVLLSNDKGRTWSQPIEIDSGSLYLPAETDVIQLKDGSLFAALRGNQASPPTNMQSSTSIDGGRTWSPVREMGFLGHSPYLMRLSTGEILLSYRGFTNNTKAKGRFTALRISGDEGRTWQGPYRIDTVPGAYPATVELKDGSVLVIYYTEGKGSAVRARRFKKPALQPQEKLSSTLQDVVSLPLDN